MNELETNGAPDCRLCTHFSSKRFGCTRIIVCVNGDQFQGLNAIQLWQKKPPEGLSQLPDKEDVEL